MAKISTRQPDPQETNIVEELQRMLDWATNGAISTKPTAKVQLNGDVGELLGHVRFVIGLLKKTGEEMFLDMKVLMHDNMVLSVKLDEAMNILEALTDVTYDHALDQATADLMDAFAASGGADVTPNGELGFDSSVLFSKADMKPILREAILRYVEQKLK